MNEKTDFLTSIGINIPNLIAGLSGAIVFIKKSKEKNLYHAFFTLVSGSLTSNYMTPIIIENIPALAKFNYGVAFIMGYMGYNIIEYVINKFIINKK